MALETLNTDAETTSAPDVRMAPPATKSPWSLGKPSGTVGVDTSILDRMQEMLAAKQRQNESFAENIYNAIAMATPAPYRAQAVEAREKTRAGREQDIFQMQSEIARYKAAQEAQRAFEKRRASELGGQATTQPTSVAAMFGMPAEIRTALSNAKTEAEYDKIYNDWAKKKAEVEASPEFDVPKIPVVMKAPDGSYYPKNISARELRANPSKYIETEGTQAAIQSVTQPKAAPAAEVDLRPDERAAPPGKPPAVSAAPATGEDSYLFKNLSPQQLDMLSKAAGDENLIRDPTKHADAESAFNKMPYDKRKRLFESLRPEGAPPAAATTPTAPVAPTPKAAPTRPPTVEELQSQAKVKEQTQIQAESERLKTDKLERDKFVTESEPTRVSERKVRAERVAKMVKADPLIVGVLTSPDVKSAIANVISQGLSTPSGSISVKGLSDAIYQTLPSTISTVKRREIAGYIANMELDAAQAMNGQGQISDGEREIIRAASISIEDPAEVVYKKARMMELRQNTLQKLRGIYGTGDKYTTNFERFKNEPEYKRIAAEYESQLRDIVNEDVQFDRSQAGKQKPAPSTGTTKSGVRWRSVP